MNREELLKNAKPILFNTEMVQAILEGRKTVTRRVVKYYSRTPTKDGKDKFYKIDENLNGTNPNRLYAGFYNNNDIFYIDGEKHIDALYYPLYFKVGDILYVRETFSIQECEKCRAGIPSLGGECKCKYVYRASYGATDFRWKSSIFMPKEAARILLKVTGIRVERLQDIDKLWSNYDKEGMRNPEIENISIAMQERFIDVWNGTIKKQDLDKYSWEANPWVWVIEFERVEVENEN